MPISEDNLGGSNGDSSVTANEQHSSADFSTDPSLSLNVSDVLSSFDASSDGDSGSGDSGGGDVSSSTGLGDLGLDLSAPTDFSNEQSSSDFDASHSESGESGGGDSGGDGGLLGGLPGEDLVGGITGGGGEGGGLLSGLL